MEERTRSFTRSKKDLRGRSKKDLRAARGGGVRKQDIDANADSDSSGEGEQHLRRGTRGRHDASLRRMQMQLPASSGAGKRKHKNKHKKGKHHGGHHHRHKKHGHGKHSSGHKRHGHHGHRPRHRHGDAGDDHRTLAAAAREVMYMNRAMRGMGGPAIGAPVELMRPLQRASLHKHDGPPRAPPASVRLRASRLSRSAQKIFDLDGTGEISTNNIASVAHRVQRSEQTAKALSRRLWLALAAALLLAAAVLGLVAWGAELVKETKISDGGKGSGDGGHGATVGAAVVVNDGNATRIAQTANAEVAAPLALAALLPAEVLRRVQHVGVTVKNVVLDAGTPRERQFDELRVGMRVDSYTRFNEPVNFFAEPFLWIAALHSYGLGSHSCAVLRNSFLAGRSSSSSAAGTAAIATKGATAAAPPSGSASTAA